MDFEFEKRYYVKNKVNYDAPTLQQRDAEWCYVVPKKQHTCRIGPDCTLIASADKCSVGQCQTCVHLECSDRLKKYLCFQHYEGVVCSKRCYQIYMDSMKENEKNSPENAGCTCRNPEILINKPIAASMLPSSKKRSSPNKILFPTKTQPGYKKPYDITEENTGKKEVEEEENGSLEGKKIIKTNQVEYEKLRVEKMESELKTAENERIFKLLSHRHDLKIKGIPQDEIDRWLPLHFSCYNDKTDSSENYD